MRVVLCSSYVPFVSGGARFIVEWLAEQLREQGHQTEVIWLPFLEHPDKMFKQICAYRMIDLAQSADKLIAFRPPAYVIPHPNKTLWFIHHFRGFYDLWDTPFRPIEDNARGRALRNQLMAMDTRALSEAKRIYTNSKVVSERLRRFNNIDSEVLYPPILKPERFQPGDYGDEIVCVCRMEEHKRQDLFVRAMRYTKSKVKLHLYGRSARGYNTQLEKLVDEYSLHERVAIDHRWISEEEKAEILSRALAVAYAPVDEDSYGYPSLEGALAEKPIITARDSGGTLEFVEDEHNGFVCEPTPEAVAERFDAVFLDRARTRRMGQAARARVRELRIDWPNVLERMLA